MTTLITGASSGIGAALAIALAERGGNLALVARRADRLAAVAATARERGARVLEIVADLSEERACRDAVDRTLETFGAIDVLVNNAGRGNKARIEDTSTEQLDSIFAINVYATFRMTAQALPSMKARGTGHIVNIASIAGKMAFPFNAAYVAAKHAVVGFTAALRTELTDTGVEATVVCPAGVRTDWADVTEGGALGDVFGSGIMKSKRFAKERGVPLAPLVPMMDAEDVAKIIVRTIDGGRSNDVFTHAGTFEQSVEAATDRMALEDRYWPLYKGMIATMEEERSGT